MRWPIFTGALPCHMFAISTVNATREIPFFVESSSSFFPHFASGFRHKGKGKGRFLELFQHWVHLAYCILAPNKFPHPSPEAPRIIQMCETSTSEGGNYYQILLANSNLRKSARIFYMPQSWDMGQIFLLPLRRKTYWGFSGHPKNPTASAGFKPAN